MSADVNADIKRAIEDAGKIGKKKRYETMSKENILDMLKSGTLPQYRNHNCYHCEHEESSKECNWTKSCCFYYWLTEEV